MCGWLENNSHYFVGNWLIVFSTYTEGVRWKAPVVQGVKCLVVWFAFGVLCLPRVFTLQVLLALPGLLVFCLY